MSFPASTAVGIELVAVLRLVGHGGTRRRGPNPCLGSVSPAPAAPVGFFSLLDTSREWGQWSSGSVSRKGDNKLGIWLGFVCESTQFCKS